MPVVRDLVIGKKYSYKGKYYGKCIQKIESNRGGSGFNEPSFLLYFENNQCLVKDWDEVFEEMEQNV